ncbi:myelin regulatory factor homolog 1 isoform X2 [Photinus pyralis]|uniref:Myelin regulatory factor n=1 Tax=Photinus pyralis TaxID=7054 RepID=A0A1Y1NHD8_PHOPY|nr:myelin regulatory factor homolog 1 isoform X2 [Photinus pyralis]
MEYSWTMEERREIKSRNLPDRGDFVGGIDNEALDFSQLEAFINSDGSQGSGTYFAESLNSTTPTSGKLSNVIVDSKRTPGHSLPESPPDSSSEHPYSPQESCDPPISTSEAIYTTLGQPIYKSNILNPIISDNLILGSHIVVTDQSADAQLLDNSGILQDARILVNNDLRNGSNLLNIHSDAAILHNRILVADEPNRPIIIQNGADPNQNYTDRTILLENCPRAEVRRTTNDLLLVKSDESQLVHLGFTSNIEMQLPQRQPSEGLCETGSIDNIQAVYTNLQNASKKRKLSQDLPLVKSEPEHCLPSQLSPPGTLSSTIDDDFAGSEGCLSEAQYQCIRFSAFQQSAWHMLCDQNLTELPAPHYRVDADKGFNFSNADDAFVCQKKNHFQITCHIQLLGDAQFVKTPDGFQKISSFHLHFYGVKYDCPTQTIRVEQSQSDRSKKPFHPVLVELINSQVTKVTVGRLHFSETTSNNMRKKGKPNPEQRYFQLVVGLHAHTTHGNFAIVSHASQKIIVRASNPGQFENDVELCWQKGQTQESIFHAGKVGINTDRPDESLVIHGNLKITGHIIQPSDVRAKKNIVECDTAKQLRNVQRLRVVKYEYEPRFAAQLNHICESTDTGVIAQEVAEVLPEAVSQAGNLVLENGASIDNFLVVNKERIFMENIGAVKELCKVTDNLETRIDQLERINRRLNKLRRDDSLKSTSTASSGKHIHSSKCFKGSHYTDKEQELCTNKFIQIIIVVLVLIMAFCLAAITTLYLIEAARHTQLPQGSLQNGHRSFTTKRPIKTVKQKTWQNNYSQQTVVPYKELGVIKASEDSSSIVELHTPTIGRPNNCFDVNVGFENANILCQIHCCIPPSPEDSDVTIYDRIQRQTDNLTKTGLLNKVANPFHTNNIDKQLRQKRDSDDWSSQDNIFEATEDHLFAIGIQGKSFNVTLSSKYMINNNNNNFTYYIPISKYMADQYVSLIFRSQQANMKEIEHCYNGYRKHECGAPIGFDESSKLTQRKVDEKVPNPLISSRSVLFEVDMVGYQSKVMTYRAALGQTQDICMLSPSKVGLEFMEYNFHFFRHCDE